MSTESAQRLAELLKVLADPARLRILSIVAAHEDHEACVCDLIAPLGLSQPTVSYHLKVLQEAGLLEREQRGVWAYYRLVPGPLALVRKALSPPPDSSVESPERAARSSWGRASS
ncbi:MAG: helix-turn-helix transcriptional regulator [Chloroflexi bacterium]|nr:helix-turn-helix transcriptional regulator [Chloroflexota bacterium]